LNYQCNVYYLWLIWTLAREDDSKQGSRASALLVRYRHQQYVNIAVDIRSGQLTASEVGSGSDEADGKLSQC
jgi:hypothetical protein